jgi:hypothetical protein
VKRGLAALIVLMLAGCAGEAPTSRPDAAASAAPASVSAAAAASAAPDLLDAGADSASDPDASSPDASDRGKPFVPPRVRLLDAPEETKSPVPKDAEWTDAVRRLVHVEPEYEVTMQRVREWAKITCSCSNATIVLVSGQRDGTVVWANEVKALAIFPIRRGDRRAFELHPNPKQVFGGGPYGGGSLESGGAPVVINELWLEGDDAPMLVVQ